MEEGDTAVGLNRCETWMWTWFACDRLDLIPDQNELGIAGGFERNNLAASDEVADTQLVGAYMHHRCEGRQGHLMRRHRDSLNVG